MKENQVACFLQPSGPPQPSVLLREFMRDVAGSKLSDIEIEDKYFCTQILHRPDEYGVKAHNVAAFWLANIRQELEKQHVNVDEVTFPVYSDLPDETMEILGGSQQAYVARYKGVSFRYFQVEGDKIGSILLIGQGDRGFFLTFCR